MLAYQKIFIILPEVALEAIKSLKDFLHQKVRICVNLYNSGATSIVIVLMI